MRFYVFRCREVNAFTLYPWVHQWTNNKYTEDQTDPVRFPDVNPSDLPSDSNFSMAAGDFLEVYNEPGKQYVFSHCGQNCPKNTWQKTNQSSGGWCKRASMTSQCSYWRDIAIRSGVITCFEQLKQD